METKLVEKTGTRTVLVKNGSYECDKYLKLYDNVKQDKNNPKVCYVTEKGKFSHYECKKNVKPTDDMCYYTDTKKGNPTNAKATTKNKTTYQYKYACAETLEGWERTGKSKTAK